MTRRLLYVALASLSFAPVAFAGDEVPPPENQPAPKAGTDSTGDGKRDTNKPDEVPGNKKTAAPGTADKPADTMENEARVALEGSYLLAIADTNDRLEVLHDKNVGKISIQGVRGRRPLVFDEAPVLYVLTESDGPQKATLSRLEGKQLWWILHAGLKGRDVAGKLRFKLEGKAHDIDLAGPHATAVAGETIVIGDAEYEVERDMTGSSGGSITLRGSGVDDLRFEMRRTEDGAWIPVAFSPVPGRPDTFRVTHEAFRNGRFEGRISGRVDGRPVQAAIGPQGQAPTGAATGTGTPATGTGTGSTGSEGGSGTPGTGTPGSGTPGSGTPGSGTPGSGTPGTGTPGSGTPGSGSTGSGSGSTGSGSTGSGSGSTGGSGSGTGGTGGGR